MLMSGKNKKYNIYSALLFCLPFLACNPPEGLTIVPSGFSETLSRAPVEVTHLSESAGNGQVTLTWKNPKPVTFRGISITYDNPGTQKQTFPPQTEKAVITGLTNGKDYTFNIRLIIDTGENSILGKNWGEVLSPGLSVKARPQTPDTTPPGEVSNLKGYWIAAAGLWMISWTDPSDNDLAGVEITYTPPWQGGKNVTFFQGRGRFPPGNSWQTKFMIKGQTYSILFRTLDTSGNKSKGVTFNYTAQ